MKFRFRNLILNERQSANCYVDTLMVIKRARVQNNESIVRSIPATRLENFRVWKIQYGRTFRSLHGPLLQALLPNVVGRDHVVGKSGRDPLDCSEEAEGQGTLGTSEFAQIKFRNQVVNI